jgi:hypothetical protein
MVLLFVLLFLACPGLAQSYVSHIEGQVSRRKVYSTNIGSGLTFTLEPTGTGWMIRLAPKAGCDALGDWATVVNPPYRGYNALFVDTGYSVTASEAVKMTQREFKFVQNCDDYKRESKRLEIVLWPYNHPKAVVDDATAKLGTSRLAEARFTIVDSKVSPAEKDIEGKNYGQIDWLKFKLDITTRSPAP